MADDGSGNFSLPEAAFVAGTVALAGKVNNNLSDIATALTARVTRNGTGSMSGNLAMGANRVTGLAAGTARTDAAQVAQVQDGGALWGGTAGGTANARTITLSPAPAAYAAGQRFIFINGAAANSGAATLNANSLGAKDIRKGNGGTALASGDMPADAVVEVVYDGTQFVLSAVSRTAAQARTAIGAPNITGDTFTGAVGFGAADHALLLDGSNNRVWRWESGTTDLAFYAPAGAFTVRLDSVDVLSATAAGATITGNLTVTGSAGAAAANTAKAFVSFNGATGAIRGTAFNVSSVTDNGTGDFTVNWGAAFPSVNYAAVATFARGTGSNPFDRKILIDSAVYSTTQMRVITGFGLATYEDQDIINVHAFGG
jgi:hypothetical protein